MPYIKLLFAVLSIFILNSAKCQNFEAVDAHALAAPRTVEKNVESLAAYLNENTQSDLEKVRSYYIWLTANIAYDTKTFFSDKPNPKTSASDALKYKKAICQGYSELFKALCEFSDIPCFLVSGYSKGYGYSTKKTLTNADHAWNTVYFDDQWHLIDATWGAGYLDENKKYVKKFFPEYFLTNPDKFILKHLPSDPMWQLLSCPLSINDYKKSANEITNQLKNCSGNFNFNDTIAAYKQLNPIPQQLESAERAFRFNPENVEAPGYALLSLSFDMGGALSNLYEKEAYTEALELNKNILEINEKAMGYFRKSKTTHAKQAVGICKQNIASSKANIKSLEKIVR